MTLILYANGVKLKNIRFFHVFVTRIVLLASDVTCFSPYGFKKGFFPSPRSFFHPSPPCLIACVCVFACCCMPPLKETRLQIKERTAREIRNRTAIRLAQLRTQFGDTDREREEESDEENVEDERSVGTRSVCVTLCCFLLCLLLCLRLNRLYHATNQNNLSL